MDKLDIEIKYSPTGSYSPWHLGIAEKHGVPLMITADIGQFVRFGDDIYKIFRSNDAHKLYQYLCMLEEMNDKGEVTDEEVLKEIDDIKNNMNKDFILNKCVGLDEFEKEIIKVKQKQDEKKTKL